MILLMVWEWVWSLYRGLSQGAVMLRHHHQQQQQQRLVRAVGFAVVFPMVWLLWPLLTTLQRLSDARLPGRPLSTLDRHFLAQFFDSSEVRLDQVTLVAGRPLLHRLMGSPPWEAFTLGSTIYLLANVRGHHRDVILLHEAYGGSCVFLALYAADLIISFGSSLWHDDVDAYLDHAAEQQAFHLENVARFRGIVAERDNKPLDLQFFRCFDG